MQRRARHRLSPVRSGARARVRAGEQPRAANSARKPVCCHPGVPPRARRPIWSTPTGGTGAYKKAGLEGRDGFGHSGFSMDVPREPDVRIRRYFQWYAWRLGGKSEEDTLRELETREMGEFSSLRELYARLASDGLRFAAHARGATTLRQGQEEASQRTYNRADKASSRECGLSLVR